MKRFSPCYLVLLLALSACNSTSPDAISPAMPAQSPATTAEPITIELFSDEFCKGGNVWWNARFNILAGGAFDESGVRVYTVDAFGERKFFGTAKTGVPELEGTDFHFYAEGIAPPDSIPDFHQAGFPANYGFVPFAFEVFNGTRHELAGTGLAYSDVPITSNLYPHACQGIKPRTGCRFACCPTNGVASDSQSDGVWYWQIGGEFLTGPCVNPTLRVKAYFVHPNGRQEIFARGEGTVTNEFGGHQFTLAGRAPVLDAAGLPSDWTPRFVIEVTSNGTPVGKFDFVAPNRLTPNQTSQNVTITGVPVALARTSSCEVFGGGIDTHADVVATNQNNRAAITIEPVSTICDEAANGIWFKVDSFLDDGTATGRRIFLAGDHHPVALRQNASGTETAWMVNIEFVPPAEPFQLVGGFFPRLVVEAYGPAGKIGEITCVVNDIPETGPRGPHLHGND